jgi:protein arginine kinase activator
MKCEKCKNEATFHYQSNINGEKSEYHLCAECAKEAGFGDVMDFRPRSMFDSFWREPFGGLMSGFFDEPFGSWGRSLMAPVMAIPQVRIMIGSPEKSEEVRGAVEAEEKAKDNIPKDAGDEIRGKRELFALKHQLRSAIRNEEFEKAAELRDRIRGLEGK